MWPNPQFPADLVTFNTEIRDANFHSLRSVRYMYDYALFCGTFTSNFYKKKVDQKN